MTRVVYFELYVENPEREMEFLKKVFGWRFERFEKSNGEFWNIKTGPKDERGIDGGLLEWEEGWGEKPGECSSLFMIEVDDLEKTLQKIEKHGGNQEMEDIEIPEVGTQKYCRTPEDNLFAIFEPSENSMVYREY